MRRSGGRGRTESQEQGRPRPPGGELDLFAGSGDAPRSYDRRPPARPARRPSSVGAHSPVVTDIPGASRRAAIPISALTRIARDVVEGAFMPLWVRGEVSDFKAHRNGHWYFCLRDETAQLRCVVWSRDRGLLVAAPGDGMQVAAFGQLSVYPARGEMQLVVTALDSIGDGLWRKALDDARTRLEADGLLLPERKRPLPRLPRRVAVVTSPDGAALHDIVSVVRRRCACVEIVVSAAKVQGDGAAAELVAAIERVSRWSGADVVIVGRGGGAREDLWAFNDERVARALAACSVPTISAVGHEIDVTLCDLVADVRAPTPSAAAECAVPVLQEERAALLALRDAMRDALSHRADVARRTLSASARTLAAVTSRAVERRSLRLEALAGRLHALSPLATLSRGYAVARADDGTTLSSAQSFTPGRRFALTLRDGSVPCTADEALPPARQVPRTRSRKR